MKKKLMIGAVVLIIMALIGGIFLTQRIGAKTIEERISLANKYVSEGKYEEAILEFKKIIEIEPKNIEARVVLGEIYVKTERYDEAEAILMEALELDDKRTDTYKMIIKLYREMDKGILDVIEFIKIAYEKTGDEMFQRMLDEYRPKRPKVSLKGGEYEGPISVKLQAETGVKILYTIDGSNPVENGKEYKEEIIIEEGNLTVKSVALNEYGLYSDVLEVEYIVEKKEESIAINFPDENLEKAVRALINKPTGEIYNTDVNKIEEVDFSERGIESIEGIQHFKSLITLVLYDNKISDISVLGGMTELSDLYLGGNKISDISVLEEVKNLTRLYLGRNEISDISALEWIKNLTHIDLYDNKIRDISILKNMKSLMVIDLRVNHIEIIKELKGLDLYSLRLNWNPIKDIDKLKEIIKEMSNIYELGMSGIDIGEINFLQDLNHLERLDIRNCNIKDIQILGELKLKKLWIDGNLLINLNEMKEIISNMAELGDLSLGNLGIEDISFLENLRKLYSLYLWDNPIQDYSPIKDIYPQLRNKDFELP